MWERDPPYDIDFPDNRFKVSFARTAALELGVGILAKPLQKPRPEIVGTVVAPFSPGVVLMGKRDFHPLSANFLLAEAPEVALDQLRQGQGGGRRRRPTSRTGAWRARFSSPTTTRWRGATAREDANSPYRFYFAQMRAKMKRGNRLYVFKSHKEQPDDEITEDCVMDNCVIFGTVNKVVDQILAMREETGDFGELVYAGMDWVDPRLPSARCS